MFEIAIGVFFLSLFGTRWFAREGGLIPDIPNARSFHSTPTPRGGGVVIILMSWLGYLTLNLFRPTSNLAVWMLLGCATTAAIIALIDDLKGLPSLLRLVFYGIAALLFAIFMLKGSPADGNLKLAVIIFLATFWINWSVNLYNFMDGTNGIAAIQAIVALAAYATLAVFKGELDLAAFFLLVAAATAGFLPSNFPKAKIFLGDCGSVFLGLFLAGIPFVLSPPNSYAWLLLWSPLAPFIIDSTATLVRRMLRGEKLSEGHRTHTYQLLAQKWNSHPKIGILYGLLSLLSSFLIFSSEVSGPYKEAFLASGIAGIGGCVFVILPQQIGLLLRLAPPIKNQ